MTHETRIALLVGLVFIVLFGLVLGQRSISFSKSSHPSSRSPASDTSPSSPPGPEVVTAAMRERDTRPVLARHEERPRPSAPATEQGEPVVSVPPAPAASVRPPVRPLRTYRVQAGDTLIRIARKVYGRGRSNQHLRIYRANRDKLSDPAALSIGQLLVIPPLDAEQPPGRQVVTGPANQGHYTEMTLTALSSHLNSERTYVVRAGDCLTAIARRTMGSGSRAAVQKLLDANRDRISNPNRLTIGMKLRIPG